MLIYNIFYSLDFHCDAGQYMDINGDQECHACPAGSYSNGNTMTFQKWDKLPKGWNTIGYSDTTYSSTKNSAKNSAKNCSK